MKSKDGKTMQPLCMAQHYQVFRIYRRPGVNSDEQIVLDRASSGDHIIVAHHNQVGIQRRTMPALMIDDDFHRFLRSPLFRVRPQIKLIAIMRSD